MLVKIRIAGAAGQGISTAATTFGRALTRAGFFAYSYNDAESRIRGGLNFNQIICSDTPIRGVTNEVDILVALTKDALAEFGPMVGDDGIVLVQGEWEHPRSAPFVLGKLASEAGSAKTSAVIAASALCALLGFDEKYLKDIIKGSFKGNEAIQQANVKGVDLGYKAVADWKPPRDFRLPGGDGHNDMLWVSGGEAIALGAVAGGVTFFAGYPMSPSTSIITSLGLWSDEVGLVVEQTEDEVGAINMVAGASYAGARAMTATSGGGFSLMNEGLSLIGMIETPAVIVIAQRPGPATGLPTRTAQGDLNFARHAGHGAFPRIILAPRDIPDCFKLTAKGFDLAEKYQVPVIILTDQLLQDSRATVVPFPTEGFPTKRYFLSADELGKLEIYQRYAQEDSGVSPLAAPGVSKQVVVVDSDEHDDDGHMVERADLASRTAGKRARKAKTVLGVAEPPQIEGNPDGKPLVVSWGSTYDTVAEARKRLSGNGDGFAHMHMHWMWPLPRDGALVDAVRKASKVVAVETSADCGLEGILREVTLRNIDHMITSLDGRPFSIGELTDRIGEVIS